jgi:hypothetical protein
MEYKCGSCREVSLLSPRAKFCPVCGSSSLILVVKELAEPAQKETVGVYKTATTGTVEEMDGMTVPEIDPAQLKKALQEEVAFIGAFPTPPPETEPDTTTKEEEDRPRRKR